MVRCIARRSCLLLAVAAAAIATANAFIFPASGTLTLQHHSTVAAQQAQQQQRHKQQRYSSALAAEKESKEVGVDDLLESPVFLNKKVEVLKKQLAKTEEDIAAANGLADVEWEEWGPQIERLHKEFDNLKIRMHNDTMEAANDARVKVITAVLAVNDNFDRASQAISPKTDGEQAVVDYYKGVYDQMQAVFKELGMEPVKTVGAPFDYNFHEAVMRQPSAEHDEDIVCQEFTKGFTVGGVLVRPALVAVSSG